MYYTGIDAGGTTFKCVIYDQEEGIIVKHRVPTTTPTETIEACIQFFKTQLDSNIKYRALGIAAFGPINVDRNSPDYGTIGHTPKNGWSNTNLKHAFETGLKVPVTIDTDVNAALLAELRLGAAQGCQTASYTTIGTGVGTGFFANGDFLGKPHHPEFGHIRVARHRLDESFAGVCGIHGDCLEGLASAPSLWKRYDDPEKLPPDHEAWDIVGYYLAQACLTQFLSLRPERIILGGGVMLSPHILPKIHSHFAELLTGYLNVTTHDIKQMIVKPALGDDAGVHGAIQLSKLMINI